MTQEAADRRRLTLPASRRIRSKRQFDQIRSEGRRLGNSYFGITVRPNGSEGPHLGLAVSIKVSGNGVERNRIRRLIRESFRLIQHELPAIDVVVGARGRVRGATGRDLRSSLAELWSKLKQ